MGLKWFRWGVKAEVQRFIREFDSHQLHHSYLGEVKRMYVVSEITGEKYNTIEECEAAEKEYLDKKEEVKQLKEIAVVAMQKYIEHGGTLNDLVRYFGNYKIVDRNFGYPLWHIWE